MMEKMIKKVLDHLTINHTERLLEGEELEMKISKRKAKRMKKAVQKKIISQNKPDKKTSWFKNFELRYAVQIAAVAVIIVSAFAGISLLRQKGDIIQPPDPPDTTSASDTTLPFDPSAPVSGTYGKWNYLEYDDHVVLTDYRLNSDSLTANLSSKIVVTPKIMMLADNSSAFDSGKIRQLEELDDTIAIPEEINGKPVTDIAQECFASIRNQSMDSSGNFHWGFFWDVPEDNPYFTIEKHYDEDSGRKYNLLIAFYNKDKTRLYCVQDDIDPNALDNHIFTIPKTITEIYDGAFMSRSVPVEVEDGNENFVIDSNMIMTKDKTRLLACAVIYAPITFYKVPGTVTKLDEGVFFNVRTKLIWSSYSTMDTVLAELPEGIKEIPDYAFAKGWTAPANIPESTERIGNYALSYAPPQSVEISSNVREIGKDAFGFRNGLTAYGQFYTDLKASRNITVNTGNQCFFMENNVLYNKDKTELIYGDCLAFYNGYQIPNIVKVIRENALCFLLDPNVGYSGELELVIPESVESIEANAIEVITFGQGTCTIYGKKGSCAETYAKSYNINFVPLDENNFDELTTDVEFTTNTEPSATSKNSDPDVTDKQKELIFNGLKVYEKLTRSLAYVDYSKPVVMEGNTEFYPVKADFGYSSVEQLLADYRLYFGTGKFKSDYYNFSDIVNNIDTIYRNINGALYGVGASKGSSTREFDSEFSYKLISSVGGDSGTFVIEVKYFYQQEDGRGQITENVMISGGKITEFVRVDVESFGSQ